jgi:hypothetical protein
MAGLVFAVGVSTTAWGHANKGPRRAGAHLDGYQVNPCISTAARGRLVLRLDDEAETIDYELSYSGLEGTATGAYIHFARRPVNGAMVVTLCGGRGMKEPCPPLEGTVRGTMTAADFAPFVGHFQGLRTFADFVSALQARALYAEVGTVRFQSGEIRGQVFEISPRHD